MESCNFETENMIEGNNHESDDYRNLQVEDEMSEENIDDCSEFIEEEMERKISLLNL